MNIENRELIGKRIKELREEHNETLDDVAKVLGLLREDKSRGCGPSVCKIERGYNSLRIEHALILAKHWNVPIDYILCQSDYQYPEVNEGLSTSDYVIAATDVLKDIRTITKAFGIKRDEAKELLKIAALNKIADYILELTETKGENK